MITVRLIVCLFVLVPIHGVGQDPIVRKKDIPYVSLATRGFDHKRNTLDIYYRADSNRHKPVFIFIHGGSWGSGNKNTYRMMGKNLAKQGLVAVIINYRLAPQVQYQAMASDCAKAVNWAFTNSYQYGGNPHMITLAGHSAGAHLAAFITMNDTFTKIKSSDPVKKLILIDPFGLDLLHYFDQYDNRFSRSLYKVFTKNREQWRNASPIYSLSPDFKTPVRIITGAKTYRIIREQSEIFYDSLQNYSVPSEFRIIPRKKHIGMITQFFRPNNSKLTLLTDFQLSSPLITQD